MRVAEMRDVTYRFKDRQIQTLMTDQDGCPVLDKAGQEIWVRYCQEFRVVSKSVDYFTGAETLKVSLWAEAGQKIFALPREKLTQRDILRELLSQGLSILDTPDDVSFILEVLHDTEASATIQYEHSRLGFINNDDRLTFLHYIK